VNDKYHTNYYLSARVKTFVLAFSQKKVQGDFCYSIFMKENNEKEEYEAEEITLVPIFVKIFIE
jgi:hypothetical protein